MLRLAKGEIEEVEVEIEESLTLNELTKNPKSIWGLLFYAGYLTLVEPEPISRKRWKLRIPNNEIRESYTTIIEIINTRLMVNLEHKNCLDTENFSKFAESFNKMVGRVLSYNSLNDEQSYQDHIAIFLAINNPNWHVETENITSNGRSDIRAFSMNNNRDIAYIFEVKYVKEEKDIESAMKKALNQIQTKMYHERLTSYGNIKKILCYAIIGYKRSIRFSKKEELKVDDGKVIPSEKKTRNDELL